MKKALLSLLLTITLQTWAQDSIEIVNIENAAVQAYMADSTYYYNDDCDLTVITNYTNRDLYGERLDRPAGKTINWTPTTAPENILEIRITLSEHSDYSDSLTHFPASKKTSSYLITNLLPNRIYYYKAEEIHSDSTIALLDQGRFRTVGQVRMIRVAGSNNVRDIGGWPTSFGVPIKYGILFRSAHLDDVTEEGYHDLVENLNVTAELDLRGLFRREPHLKSSRMGDKIDFTRIVADSYALSSNRFIYAQALNWIISRLREGKHVDWHCGVGCDRCGTLSFLIEGVLGMSEVDLCRDYELSSLKGHKRYRGHVGFRKLLPWMKSHWPDTDLTQCFYNYWVESGVSESDIKFLRDVMLDK